MSFRAENMADIPGVLTSLSLRYLRILSFFSEVNCGVCGSSCWSYFCSRGSSARSSPTLDLLGFLMLVGVDGSTKLLFGLVRRTYWFVCF